MANLEPSLQTRTSRNVTVTSDNSCTFIDHVVFASSLHAPYAVFRELSVPAHDDDVVCESDTSMENALMTSGTRHQVSISFANAASKSHPNSF